MAMSTNDVDTCIRDERDRLSSLHVLDLADAINTWQTPVTHDIWRIVRLSVCILSVDLDLAERTFWAIRRFSYLNCFSHYIDSPQNMSMITSPSVELSSYRDQHFKVSVKWHFVFTYCNYMDTIFQGTRAEQDKLLRLSTTLYIGNLSFYTTEEQIYELFSKCGDIRRIVMGLDKYKKTPCGFCFLEYYTREDAENCLR